MILSKRQHFILNFIESRTESATRMILGAVKTRFDSVSRLTVIRDLNLLIREGLIRRQGKGRTIYYEPTTSFLLRDFDPETYFLNEPDQRTIQSRRLQFLTSEGWHELLNAQESAQLQSCTTLYQKRLKHYSASAIRKELQRITIEFSWKSSKIEGNTYSLLDTERLLTVHEEASGHSRAEARMILNHKKAFDYITLHSKNWKTLSVSKIEEIHTLLIEGLDVDKGLRKHPVGVVGTAYRPHDNIYQVREALEALCRLINALSNPFIKSLAAVAGVSYLQPFGDGNKRTGRVLGNALLMHHRCCPLSYRSVDEVLCKKAMILFYEQHSLVLFKRLMLEQYRFAVDHYFL
jgi:hypothetical protein